MKRVFILVKFTHEGSTFLPTEYRIVSDDAASYFASHKWAKVVDDASFEKTATAELAGVEMPNGAALPTVTLVVDKPTHASKATKL